MTIRSLMKIIRFLCIISQTLLWTPDGPAIFQSLPKAILYLAGARNEGLDMGIFSMATGLEKFWSRMVF